jgi:hypothetical protein
MSRAAVIFVFLVTATASTAVAQTTPAQDQTGTGTLPVSLDRIRKALDETNAAHAASDPNAPKLHVDVSNVPVFRTQTASTGIPLSSLWDDGTSVAAYIRPPNGLYDYEFKQMVTPDAVKGCGRLTQMECVQSYANQFVTGWLWQRATQKKTPASASTSAPPASPVPPPQ